jgi:transposase
MIPLRPQTRHEHRHHAPRQAPCPHCGTLAPRKQKLTRTVRSLAYQAILLVTVTTAEYRAACDCCTTFRTQVEGVEPKAQYTNAVREAVLDRLLDDHMNLDRIRAALKRDFLLDLSTGFVYDCLRWKARQLDLAAYRRWTLQEFSGTLCLDEIHLGRLTLLLATDPLEDFPVAFALVSRNDGEHVARFLRSLRDHGFHPKVVVTDGSTLYPGVLARVWPAAAHQLCVFHVLQDFNRTVLEAVRRLRKSLTRRAGRGRGRPGRWPKAQAERRRRRRELRRKAAFVFRHRYLLVRRREALSARERRNLMTLLEYLPSAGVLRQFVDRLHRLVDHAQTTEQAWQRFAALHAETAFAAVPELARAVAGLSAEKFAKVVAFLHGPVGARVRTNNHVERLNRQWRYAEKVRYRWRRARSVVRFVVLVIERRWRARSEAAGPQWFEPGAGGPKATAGGMASGSVPEGWPSGQETNAA